jgi:hypothetical protein
VGGGAKWQNYTNFVNQHWGENHHKTSQNIDDPLHPRQGEGKKAYLSLYMPYRHMEEHSSFVTPALHGEKQ